MTANDWKNQLYFGDNLGILRNRVADASVDLIYLDPPFNSNANYNVLFQEKTGRQSDAPVRFRLARECAIPPEPAVEAVLALLFP